MQYEILQMMSSLTCPLGALRLLYPKAAPVSHLCPITSSSSTQQAAHFISCLAFLIDSTTFMLLNASLLLLLPALPGSAIESLLQCSFSSVFISGDLNYLSLIVTLLVTNPSKTSYLFILCNVYLVTAVHCWRK